MLLFWFISDATAAWELAGFSNRADAFVETETIVRKGNLVRVWVMYSDTVVDPNKSYRSLKSFQEYNCQTRENRLLYESQHSGEMGGGETIFSTNINQSAWTPIAPDSVAESIRKFICKK